MNFMLKCNLPCTRHCHYRQLLRFALIFVMCLCAMQGLAQEKNVTGTVTNASTGDALIGASVIVEGTSAGVSTDVEGKFSIKVKDGQTLTVSYIGFFPKSIKVTKSTTRLDISLEENTQVLDQVVVVGYGTMKRSDLTGAVSSIDEAAIKQGVNTSVEQALQGRIAGVQVTQNSGAPGGGISVQIRGINSLNGNEPLYVIDGVAVSGQTGDNSSVLASVNPSDITSVEVLKDASATAIYGSRASNGVVLITTRRGSEGKPRLSYEGYAGWQKLPTQLEVMNLWEYADYYNTRAEIMGWGVRDEFKDPSLLTKGTDWQKELFRTAFMHNHQLGVTGGSQYMNYAVSGGYLDQDGIGLGSGFKRASLRANLDMTVTSWLKAGLNASYAHTKQIVTLDNSGLISTALDQRPDVSPYNADGTFGFVKQDNTGTYYSNPLFEATMKENYNTNSQFYYNMYADINPLKGLNFRLEYGGNKNFGNSYFFCPNYQYGTVVVESESNRGSSRNDYWSLKLYANYNLNIAQKHDLNIMAGHEAQESSWETLWGSRKGFISSSIHNLDVGDASTAKSGNDGGSWGIESWFGRLNYNFDNRYLLTATLRSDGSSNLGSNNRWGTFPSLAVAWRINNEKFMKSLTSVDNLKLRFGWGKVGNQNAGTYAYGIIMKNTATAWGTGYYPGNYSNPNLKWEQTEAWNVGLDLAMFNNRLEFIVDAYYKNTDNLLMTASLPSYIIDSEYIGMSAPWVNAGAMNNKGVEFTLNTVNISNKDFSWRSGLTLSFNRNKLTRLYSEDSKILGRIGDEVFTQSEVGQPVGQFFGYNVIGMFRCEDDFYQKNSAGEFLLDASGSRIPVARPAQSDGELYPIAENSIWLGDYIFEDVDGDGKITEKDRKYIGNPNPDFTFGFNNVFTYKNFTLSMFINGSVGNDVYNVLRQKHTDPLGYGNKMKEVANYARIEMIDPDEDRALSNLQVVNGSSASVQRVSAAGQCNNDNNRVSSRFVEDGSYIRLKSLSLSYDLPKSWLGKIGFQQLQVYANAQNLFTITKYKGYDPEIGAQGQDVTKMGLDNGRYPSQRIYNVGVRVNF